MVERVGEAVVVLVVRALVIGFVMIAFVGDEGCGPGSRNGHGGVTQIS